MKVWESMKSESVRMYSEHIRRYWRNKKEKCDNDKSSLREWSGKMLILEMDLNVDMG